MSDFETALERLISDPDFRAAMQADPESALRGLDLDDRERQLLLADLELGDDTQRVVEDRVSKSGLFGMVAPVVSGLGFVTAPVESQENTQIRLFAEPAAGEPAGGLTRLHAAQAPPPSDGVGTLVSLEGGTGRIFAVAPQAPAAGTPAVDYETRVDADGDGTWDEYRAVERGDGGVDLLVDRDGDGRVDWVGHDLDRDGLIDSADVDLDHDGVLEAHFVDDTGDGWLDRRVEKS